MKRGVETLDMGDDVVGSLVSPESADAIASSPVSPIIEETSPDGALFEEDLFGEDGALFAKPAELGRVATIKLPEEIQAELLALDEEIKPEVLGLVKDPDAKQKHTVRERSDYMDVPAEFRPNVYGDRIIKPVRLGDLIMVDQTRRGKNSEEGRIAQSIEQNGLINIPEVTILDANAFRAYLNVVYYRKYGGKMPDEVFDQYGLSADGTYKLVVSGHTRTRGMISNEKKRAKKAKEAGYTVNPYDAEVYVNIELNMSPEEILARQIAENFHSAPPTEDVALVTVSHYKYLRDHGKIRSQEDYVALVGGSLSPDILAGMLAYSRLPERIHELVGEKAVPLSVAIELSKLRERKMLQVGLDIYGYEFATQIGTLDSDQDRSDKGLLQAIDDNDFAKINDVVEQWLVQQAVYLYNKHAADSRFSASKQKLYVSKIKEQIEQDIKELELPALTDLDENLDIMHGTLPGRTLTGREGLRATEEKLQRELARQVREIAQNPFDKVDEVVRIVSGIGHHSVEQVTKDARVRAAMAKVAKALQVSDNQMDALFEFVDQSNTGE